MGKRHGRHIGPAPVPPPSPITLAKLPRDVLNVITGNLSIADASALGSTCKELRCVSAHHALLSICTIPEISIDYGPPWGIVKQVMESVKAWYLATIRPLLFVSYDSRRYPADELLYSRVKPFEDLELSFDDISESSRWPYQSRSFDSWASERVRVCVPRFSERVFANDDQEYRIMYLDTYDYVYALMMHECEDEFVSLSWAASVDDIMAVLIPSFIDRVKRVVRLQLHHTDIMTRLADHMDAFEVRQLYDLMVRRGRGDIRLREQVSCIVCAATDRSVRSPDWSIADSREHVFI